MGSGRKSCEAPESRRQADRERERRKRLRKRRQRVRLIGRLTLCCLTVALAVLTFIVYRNLENGETAPVKLQASGEYPESLLELLEKNPEAEQFVLDYPTHKDRHQEIDLTGEVTKGTIPLFLQWDERWGYETYGDDFLAVTGCGPACLSMVWCGLTGETRWNPYETAKWAQEQGFYVDGSGSSWNLMTDGARELGLSSDSVIFDGDHIVSTLRNGSPIICAMRPGDFTTTGHFIVLSGVDEEGKVIVRDPNSRSNSEKTWDVEKLIPQIKNLWDFKISL